MKNQLIATVVGALIIFIWQFMSWGPLQVHSSEFQYHPNQDKVLEALTQNLGEDGEYFIPNVPPGTSSEAHEEHMKNSMGKPWAKVIYRKAYNMNFGMNLSRGMAVDLLAVWLLVWMLMKMGNPSFQTAVLSSLAVGAIGYLTIPYMNSIWFESSTMGYIVDFVVQWGLVGAWLGWFLNRK